MLQLQQPLRDDSASRLRRHRQGCRSRTSTNQFGPWRGANLALLCPRLTPATSRPSLLRVAPGLATGHGPQVSLSKNVNSCCTTGPFISGAEHRAALCRASSPAPSTLYGLSVRRLISFDLWLPSHGASRLR